jgi:signal peptidase I
LGSLLVILSVGYVIIGYAYQSFRMVGPSMETTLHSGDVFWAQRFHGNATGLGRGDIVVFAIDRNQLRVKRVIAIPGDRVRISNAKVPINGRELQESYLPEAWTWSDTWKGGSEQVVPPESFFVLGDNRNHSTDSRSLGYVRAGQVRAKATMRVLPRFGEKL